MATVGDVPDVKWNPTITPAATISAVSATPITVMTRRLARRRFIGR
jgi:hypothetical protein